MRVVPDGFSCNTGGSLTQRDSTWQTRRDFPFFTASKPPTHPIANLISRPLEHSVCCEVDLPVAFVRSFAGKVGKLNPESNLF